jgi:hypothetical protein
VRPAWPQDTGGGFVPRGAAAARPRGPPAERQQPKNQHECGTSAGGGISCGGRPFAPVIECLAVSADMLASAADCDDDARRRRSVDELPAEGRRNARQLAFCELELSCSTSNVSVPRPTR